MVRALVVILFPGDVHLLAEDFSPSLPVTVALGV